jgi:site-specific DNA recombinase
MKDFNYFKRFIPKNDTEVKANFSVWSYTRVSSRDQFLKNGSVDLQRDAARQYALDHNFQITEEFGGTYESAKSDFTRKEFKRLIDKIKEARKKPYAILVYKMSRFSRSGGNAIGLVNALVEELGVNLIEVSTGKSTITERGRVDIFESLFHAHKENLEKKEIVIPRMKASLKSGTFAGKCGIGYDQYGPKVRNEKFLRAKQSIVINQDGELLKEAWKWKVSGLFSDAQILNRLETKGLIISPQKISQIWRNPFYCGIIVNKLVDDPVKGNWEPLVTPVDFIKVQKILEGNFSGYQHIKEEERRPLTRLLKCDYCKGYMVGYRNKQKDLHYYRCLKCNGVSLNAHTTKKSLRKGANDLFLDHLAKYRLPKNSEPLIKIQVSKMFDHEHKGGSSHNEEHFENQYKAIEAKIKKLKIRQGLEEIDQETYDLAFAYLNEQLTQLGEQFNTRPRILSNLDKLLSYSLEKQQNINDIWDSSNFEGKQRIQKTMFPEGIFYNVEKHLYLTGEINRFIRYTSHLASVLGQNENRISRFDIEKSYSAPPSGLEPETL